MLNILDFVLKTMGFVLKMMDFILKLTGSEWGDGCLGGIHGDEGLQVRR